MKIFLALVVVAVVVLGAGGYYVYDKLTYQPEWYSARASDAPRIEPGRAEAVYSQLVDALGARRPVTLGPEEIEAVVAAQVAERLGLPAEEVVKGMKTSIGRWGASVEMVVDVNRLSTAAISPRARELVEEALAMLPTGAAQSTFIKLEIPPGESPRGALAEAALAIGGLRIPAAEVRSRLGLDTGALAGRLDELMSRYRARFEMGELVLTP